MALQSRDSGKQSSSVPGKRHLCCNFVSWSEIHHWDGWCGWFGSYLRLETTIKGWMKWKLLYKVNLIWTVLITVAEGHMLIQDLFTLFCSLILFACGALKNNFICSLHFYVQPDSTKVKLWLWHVQQKNFKILTPAGKYASYHLLDDNNIYSSHFQWSAQTGEYFYIRSVVL